jgi:hypothetical protein
MKKLLLDVKENKWSFIIAVAFMVAIIALGWWPNPFTPGWDINNLFNAF